MSKSKVLAFFPPILAIVAWVLALIGSFRCNNVSIDIDVNDLGYSLDFGLFNYQGFTFLVDSNTIYYVQSCFRYPNITIDSYWKTAKAFAIIAIIFGGIVMILDCVVLCVNEGDGPPKTGYRVFAGIYFFCALCQGLTLLFLKSNACRNNPILDADENIENAQFEAECNLSYGASCTIAAVAVWFLAGACLCYLGRIERADEAPEQMGYGEGVDEEEVVEKKVEEGVEVGLEVEAEK